MRKVLRSILQAFGVMAIFESGEGKRALDLLREMRPDVVFLDWKMPDMTGLEITKAVRTTPASPNPFIPIIMLTGHAQASHVLQARDAGVTEVLVKPISPKGILTRLTTVIENPRSFVRTHMYFGPCRRRRNTDDYQGIERRGSGSSFDEAANGRATAREHVMQ
jgi:CheY-like chemotaxis protein